MDESAPSRLDLLRRWKLPVDGCLPHTREEVVDTREWMTAEKAAVRRERARMRRLDDEMARIRDQAAFLSCRTAPKDEGERFLTCSEEANDGIGEPLPSVPCM